MKPALLIIDMQEAFYDFDPDTSRSLKQAEDFINAVIPPFREKGLPIFVIEDIDEGSGRIPGAPGFATVASIDLLPEDPRIHKVYSNAFNKTPLHDQLQSAGVDTVILTGFAASKCVLSTCRGAADLDYTPILLRDALADFLPDRILFTEQVNNLISYGALIKFLENCG